MHLAITCVCCSFDSFSIFLLSLKRQNLMKITFSCIHFPVWPYPPQIMKKNVFYTSKLYGLTGMLSYLFLGSLGNFFQKVKLNTNRKLQLHQRSAATAATGVKGPGNCMKGDRMFQNFYPPPPLISHFYSLESNYWNNTV